MQDGVGAGELTVADGAYEVDDDPNRIDADAAWAFLSTEAYWGKSRTREMFDRQLASAWRLVGAYTSDTGAMVGFARAMSDGVTLAYLADVYVHPEHRGHGLGKQLVEAMIDNGPGADFRWMLHTSDAHTLYGKFGFTGADQTFLQRERTQPELRP